MGPWGEHADLRPTWPGLGKYHYPWASGQDEKGVSLIAMQKQVYSGSMERAQGPALDAAHRHEASWGHLDVIISYFVFLSSLRVQKAAQEKRKSAELR